MKARAYTKITRMMAVGYTAHLSREEVRNLSYCKSLVQQMLLDFAHVLNDDTEMNNPEETALRLQAVAREMHLELPSDLSRWVQRNLDEWKAT